jgi:hypothetical protein
MFHVFSERRGRDPECPAAFSQEHGATARRSELRRTYLLSIIVAISEPGGRWIGAVRNAPSLHNTIACKYLHVPVLKSGRQTKEVCFGSTNQNLRTQTEHDGFWCRDALRLFQ